VDDASETGVRLKPDIVVIGAGQAGLSSAYHLKRRGLTPAAASSSSTSRLTPAGRGSSVGRH